MSFLSLINSYEDAWKAVVMPPRQDYSLSNLGPSEFNVRNNRIQRLDFKLQNRRGYIIECSYYEQSYIEGAVPCVIYLHGSGCSRVEALQYMDLILGHPISLFTFDFTACGKSEGTYSSVGWFEQDDLDCVLKFLYGTGKVSKICLWGRSMGATTALLYSANYPQIECLVLDSAYSHFKKLIKEIAKKKASIPGFLTGSAYNMIRKTIQAKANFDIAELKPINYVDKIKLPALFGVGKDDDFVLPQHTKNLYEAYLGEKSLEIFDGDHNSLRPPQWLLAVQGFIKHHLLGPNVKTPNESPVGSPVKKSVQSMVQTHTQISSLTSHGVSSARKSNENSPSRRVHPRSMQFSWLSNNHTGSQKHLLQPTKVENLTTIEDKLANQAKEKPAGSPQKKGLRARGNTATATTTTAATVTNFSEASYRKDTSKIFSDSYFTSATGIKSEPDELDSEKGVIAQQTWQLGNGKGIIGPKLTNTNPDDDKALSSREAARARVGGGSELMRSLSMSSKGWAATVIANEINKINKASVGQTPIHDPSPKVFVKEEVNLSYAPAKIFHVQDEINKMNKASVGQTPVHDPSPKVFVREEATSPFNARNNQAQNLASALNWLNPQPVLSYSANNNSNNHSFTTTTTLTVNSNREPQVIPGHRKRGTNLSGTFLPGHLKLGDASPGNDYFPKGVHFEKISSAKSSLTSTLTQNPTSSLGVTHNSAQIQPKVDLSPSYTYSHKGPNVYSPMNARTDGHHQSRHVTSPSVHAIHSYLGTPDPAHKTSFTDATAYKSYLNSSPNPSPYGLDYQNIQAKSYDDKSNSLLSYKDYEATTAIDRKLATPGMYSYLPQSSSYSYKGI